MSSTGRGQRLGGPDPAQEIGMDQLEKRQERYRAYLRKQADLWDDDEDVRWKVAHDPSTPAHILGNCALLEVPQ